MRILLIASVLAFAVSSSAIATENHMTGAIELKDGGIVHIYKDGKMAMENAAGNSYTMPDMTPMETKDGHVIMMRGSEVWRLYRSADGNVYDDVVGEGH